MTPPPRLLCDEMLGRLSRYLRILGCDTLYAQGLDDDQIVDRLRRDPRLLLTRDRALAGRTDPAVLLRCTDLPGQLREVRRSVDGVPVAPRFDRCTECNAPLVLQTIERLPDRTRVPEPPPALLWECTGCGHVYWEGSHTARLRSDLASWLGAVS